MIKLNNKNITYVALADSNNSLKAPKEIWYADSNNSVKLVYRRKDALIEGEDYEKYHWLVGDGSAYIDTNYILKPTDDIHLIVDTTGLTGLKGIFGTISFIVGEGATTTFIVTYGNGFAFRYFSTQIEPSARDNISDVTFSHGTSEVIINNTSYPITIGDTASDYSLLLFTRKRVASNRTIDETQEISTCKFASFDVSGVMNLVPCKLLKPVPKWLDANGIRRQIGECGMIDLVSGKFYGNVNSVGTFTVENYYERKEWLVGDGKAYIDTNIIVDVPSLYINTSFTKREGRITPLFGSRDLVTTSGSQIWYLSDGNLRLDIITNGTDYVNVDSNDIQSYNQLIVDCSNNVVSVNGITFSSDIDNLSIKNSSNTFKIFSLEVLNNPNTYNEPYNGAFGNFAINDSTHSLNLIPCILTMDLPASMDANNIARTKGTSGMWDLVSDRFYGNVASSGTFKAVNLAEGVDYEVHQWLVGEIPIGASMLSLPVNSSSFEFKCKFFTPSNCGYFNTNGYSYYKDLGAEAMKIWSSSDYRWASQTTVSDGDLIEIISTPSNTTINGESVPQKGFPITSIRFNQAANAKRQSTKYTSSIYVDGVERYIPCRLLRPIPAALDANGIARNADECGMYDTVNDVFYGNVASSGSFSCVNDS